MVNISNKEIDIPDNLSIKKWYTFIPPLIDFKISSENSQPLSDTFYDDIVEAYSKGKKNNLINDCMN